MLAEVFMLRLEANWRASKFNAGDSRFVAIAPPTVPAVEATVPAEATQADKELPLGGGHSAQTRDWRSWLAQLGAHQQAVRRSAQRLNDTATAYPLPHS